MYKYVFVCNVTKCNVYFFDELLQYSLTQHKFTYINLYSKHKCILKLNVDEFYPRKFHFWLNFHFESDYSAKFM